jgi:hypothetical protein
VAREQVQQRRLARAVRAMLTLGIGMGLLMSVARQRRLVQS